MKKILKKFFAFLISVMLLLPQNIIALTFNQKIGMNGHVDVPKDILYAGGVVREYHNFGWSITENKQMYFNRFSWWNFDEYYRNLYNNGITILPCIQMGEQSVFNRNRNEKPVMPGDDTTDPQSYKIHSNYLFNYAARYGSTVVDSSKLNLDPNEEVKTGLGYITYYEDWNEPDKTWQGPDAQFNAIELVAMLSADYDGHEGRLGDTYGVKQADPNSKLVMGGMAGGSAMVNWLNEMQAWANVNRTDKKIPTDVINYHQYTSTHSPENSSFVSDALKIIEWKNNNDPSKEIWITEFGWDTNLGSSHAAPSEDTQRDWIVREYLIGDRIGLDRVVVYDALNDGPSSDSTQYSTSGLATNGNEGFVKKSSWYGVNTAKNALNGFSFSEVIKEDNIYIYKYTNYNTLEDCYVLWSPTENGTTISNYKFNVGNRLNASLTSLKNGEALGVTSNVEIKNEEVTLNVSESPIFLKVSGQKQEEVNVSDDNKNDNEKIEENNTTTDIIPEAVAPKEENITEETNIINNNPVTTDYLSKNILLVLVCIIGLLLEKNIKVQNKYRDKLNILLNN